MSTNFPIKREMKQLLDLVQAEYDREVSMTKYFRNKYEEFCMDEEIQQLNAEIERLRRLSLHVMSEQERDDEQAFRHAHYEKCGNGNDYEYNLIGTGIGTIIAIKCPVCGERKDITDIRSW